MYKKLSLPLGLLATFATLVGATSALAATPTGEFAVFAACPYTNTSVNGCVYAKTESGEFIVGKKTVPITKTITLQGGLINNFSTGESTMVAATNGETLSKTPQNVPGGLTGLVNCQEITGKGILEKLEKASCEAVFENGATGVTATTELAAAPSDVVLDQGRILEEKGIALKLPVKVHLENPLLGSECYVGSNSDPIELELTSGATSPPAPNKSIKGKAGTLKFSEEDEIETIKENSLVNNSFAAPGASGCGGLFSFVLDPIIDSQLGVPSAAGYNTAILNGTLKAAEAEAVAEHA
jgi:hypothetical protein